METNTATTIERPPMPSVYSGWEFKPELQDKIYQHNRYGFLGKCSGWVISKDGEIDRIHVNRYDPDTLPLPDKS